MIDIKNLDEFFKNKEIKLKDKTEILANYLLVNPDEINNLLEFALKAKDPLKATCIEAIEYATKVNPTISNLKILKFATKSLESKAPRVKWESAKVIANIAHLYTDYLDLAVSNLLKNTEHEGTVVRWSAATALSAILKLNLEFNKELLVTIKSILNREEKNSIKKIYQNALKIT